MNYIALSIALGIVIVSVLIVFGFLYRPTITWIAIGITSAIFLIINLYFLVDASMPK